MQRSHHGHRIQSHRRQVEHALTGIENRAVARAAAQVAREFVGQLLARGLAALLLVMLIGRPQRHHDAGRAEAALRTMALHHGLLYRMQALRACRLAGAGRLARALALEIFHREQGLAMQAGQELNAGIDGLQAQAVDGLLVAGFGQARR